MNREVLQAYTSRSCIAVYSFLSHCCRMFSDTGARVRNPEVFIDESLPLHYEKGKKHHILVKEH
jgi:hypothetical protein